jgi:hypothetical protein
MKAYPNPFDDQVCVEFSNGTRNQVILEIYDINGALVWKRHQPVIPNARNRLYWNGQALEGFPASGRLFLINLKDPEGNALGNQVIIKE